jgi:hypothetical protein
MKYQAAHTSLGMPYSTSFKLVAASVTANATLHVNNTAHSPLTDGSRIHLNSCLYVCFSTKRQLVQ